MIQFDGEFIHESFKVYRSRIGWILPEIESTLYPLFWNFNEMLLKWPVLSECICKVHDGLSPADDGSYRCGFKSRYGIPFRVRVRPIIIVCHNMEWKVSRSRKCGLHGLSDGSLSVRQVGNPSAGYLKSQLRHLHFHCWPATGPWAGLTWISWRGLPVSTCRHFHDFHECLFGCQFRCSISLTYCWQFVCPGQKTHPPNRTGKDRWLGDEVTAYSVVC